MIVDDLKKLKEKEDKEIQASVAFLLKNVSNHTPFLAHLRFHLFPVQSIRVTENQNQPGVKGCLVS